MDTRESEHDRDTPALITFEVSSMRGVDHVLFLHVDLHVHFRMCRRRGARGESPKDPERGAHASDHDTRVLRVILARPRGAVPARAPVPRRLDALGELGARLLSLARID